MRIITLTTDYGLRDHYVGALKGTLICRIPNISMIDIAHEVEKFNSDAAGFVVSNAFPFFPKGSIHFVDVGIRFGHELVFYLVFSEGHWFIFNNPDIGNKLFYGKQHDVWMINLKANNPFSFFLDDKMMDTLAWLESANDPASSLGDPIQISPFDRYPVAPFRQGNILIGYIEYTDHYGNLHTNLPEYMVREFTQGKRYQVIFCGESMDIYESLATIGASTSAALFNYFGKLVIVVNQNNANRMLYNNTNPQVQIELIEW
jgi:S-adenosylmethionine hydrolase